MFWPQYKILAADFTVNTNTFQINLCINVKYWKNVLLKFHIRSWGIRHQVLFLGYIWRSRPGHYKICNRAKVEWCKPNSKAHAFCFSYKLYLTMKPNQHSKQKTSLWIRLPCSGEKKGKGISLKDIFISIFSPLLKQKNLSVYLLCFTFMRTLLTGLLFYPDFINNKLSLKIRKDLVSLTVELL